MYVNYSPSDPPRQESPTYHFGRHSEAGGSTTRGENQGGEPHHTPLVEEGGETKKGKREGSANGEVRVEQSPKGKEMVSNAEAQN